MQKNELYVIINVVVCTISTIVCYFIAAHYDFGLFKINEFVACISIVIFIMIPTYYFTYSLRFDNKACFKKRIMIYKLLKTNNDLIPIIDDYLMLDYKSHQKKYLSNKTKELFGNKIDIDNYDIDNEKSRICLINEIKRIKITRSEKRYRRVLISDLKHYNNEELLVTNVILDYETGDLIKKHRNAFFDLLVTISSMLLSFIGIIGIKFFSDLDSKIYIIVGISLVVNISVEVLFYFNNRNYYIKLYEYVYMDFVNALNGKY